ncbi:hypothetical protein [Desulfosporosinus sp. BG]|uniref:hypothetical protein n=1 Tax=Desulfosporosinus sp. BG TaxID=1633135 RepID=UPI00085860E1|nr:hypothetical protein [Desulfosporosinus sp. BG]ODA40051.1 hypothetical protein DSBG_3169 [Desulfosporosinus sp. BG]
MVLQLAKYVTIPEDIKPAEWLLYTFLERKRGTPVGSVIPNVFNEYARVFHPAEDNKGCGIVRWSEVAAWSGRSVHPEMQWEAICQPVSSTLALKPPLLGQCPREELIPLTELLAVHTTSLQRCWVCFWEGYAGIDEAIQRLDQAVPRIQLPDRGYYLLNVPLDKIAKGVFINKYGHEPLIPSLWWPDDRTWCVATEIDFRWTYVGGSRVCINELLADRRLECLATKPEHRGDYLSDVVNGPVLS